MTLLSKAYDLLENPHSRGFYLVNDILAFFTILSIIALAMETVASFSDYHYIFVFVEYVAVAVFTAEYLIRLANTRTKYVFSFFGIIDLLAVLPSYFVLANLTFLKSIRILRLLRFLRMLRLAKIFRFVGQHPTTQSENKLRLEKLNLQIYFVTLGSAIVVFGALIYAVEGYREEFANIFLGMLWASKVIMGGILQTVPETIWGDIVIVMGRFTGLVLFGLLITVVGGLVQKILFGNEKMSAN